MKRMLNVIMCAVLIFALAACGGSSSAPAKNRIRVDNVIGMTVDQAVETLKKNGAVNIVTNRDDYADVESDRLIVVSQNDTEGKEIQPEWEVKLTCRRLCSVYVEAKSKTNLLLHTYDMEIYLDDEMIGTAANGETICATVDAIEGEHTLKAVKASNNNVSATKQFTVAGDTTVLTLIAHGGKIEFEAFESSAGIDHTSEETAVQETEDDTKIPMPDLKDMILEDALDLLDQLGFEGSIDVMVDKSFDNESEAIVVDQDIEPGTMIDKEAAITLDCEKIESEEETEETEAAGKPSVFYSTNSRDIAKNGDTGVYAYKSSGVNYDIYYIIDFDEGCVYWFTDGNGDSTCDRVMMDSGDLNNGLQITYHDRDDSTWCNWLHFKYWGRPDHLIMVDDDLFEYDYYATDLEKALAIRDTKTLHDF